MLGAVPEFVCGQSRSVKCVYYGDSVERVVVRPGEFVVTDMHFNKTRAVSLGRSRLIHDPVIHIVLVWTRLTLAFVANVKQMGVRPGCSGSLQPYRHYGGEISALACVKENHLNNGSRIGDPSVRIVKPAAFLRWAYRHLASTHMTDEKSPWSMLRSRLKPKSRESRRAKVSRRALSCEALQALQAASHGGQASHTLNVDVQEIVDLGESIHELKDPLLSVGFEPLELNKSLHIASKVARLEQLKEQMMLRFANEFAVEDDPLDANYDTLDELLCAISFQQPWCLDDEQGSYMQGYAKVMRSIYNLVSENIQSANALQERKVVADVLIPRDVLPVRPSEIELHVAREDRYVYPTEDVNDHQQCPFSRGDRWV